RDPELQKCDGLRRLGRGHIVVMSALAVSWVLMPIMLRSRGRCAAVVLLACGGLLSPAARADSPAPPVVQPAPASSAPAQGFRFERDEIQFKVPDGTRIEVTNLYGDVRARSAPIDGQ